ncbi:MAG: hypothetical protein AB8H80_02335 [Planctomycetota bacterium]
MLGHQRVVHTPLRNTLRHPLDPLGPLATLGRNRRALKVQQGSTCLAANAVVSTAKQLIESAPHGFAVDMHQVQRHRGE